MRKIHSHLAEVVGWGRCDGDQQKRINKNILYKREGEFCDVSIYIYDRLTFTNKYKRGGKGISEFEITLDRPFSPTYKGYINAICKGLGADSHFYVKDGKVQNKYIMRDDEGLYLTRFGGSRVGGKVRIKLTDSALDDYAFNDLLQGGVK